MSLYDYFTGQQSWKDHVNNRDLWRRFENALTKSGAGMALPLNTRVQHSRLSVRVWAHSTDSPRLFQI